MKTAIIAAAVALTTTAAFAQTNSPDYYRGYNDGYQFGAIPFQQLGARNENAWIQTKIDRFAGAAYTRATGEDLSAVSGAGQKTRRLNSALIDALDARDSAQSALATAQASLATAVSDAKARAHANSTTESRESAADGDTSVFFSSILPGAKIAMEHGVMNPLASSTFSNYEINHSDGATDVTYSTVNGAMVSDTDLGSIASDAAASNHYIVDPSGNAARYAVGVSGTVYTNLNTSFTNSQLSDIEDAGYSFSGVASAIDAMIEDAVQESYDEGYKDGYRDGYDEGFKDGINYVN